jgi:hypothetical protein
MEALAEGHRRTNNPGYFIEHSQAANACEHAQIACA